MTEQPRRPPGRPSAASQPRLPLEPLVRMYGSVSVLARTTGRHTSQVAKWNRGGVPMVSADRIAIAPGAHPIEVWPNGKRSPQLPVRPVRG